MKYARALKGLGALSMMAVATVVAAENDEFLWSQEGPVVSCQPVETGGNGGRTHTFGDTTYEVIDPGQRDELISKAATACTTLWRSEERRVGKGCRSRWSRQHDREGRRVGMDV